VFTTSQRHFQETLPQQLLQLAASELPPLPLLPQATAEQPLPRRPPPAASVGPPPPQRQRLAVVRLYAWPHPD